MTEKWTMTSREYHYDQIFPSDDDRVAGDNWGCTVPCLPVQSDSLIDLIIEICRAHGWKYDPEAWDVRSDGKIQTVFEVTEDGKAVTKEDRKRWKRGELKLYDCTVCIGVEKLLITVPDEDELERCLSQSR